MKNLESAIEAAHAAEIGRLYKTFFEAMVMAEKNTSMIKDAQDRFKTGLDTAADIYLTARTLAGLAAL